MSFYSIFSEIKNKYTGVSTVWPKLPSQIFFSLHSDFHYQGMNYSIENHILKVN